MVNIGNYSAIPLFRTTDQKVGGSNPFDRANRRSRAKFLGIPSWVNPNNLRVDRQFCLAASRRRFCTALRDHLGGKNPGRGERDYLPERTTRSWPPSCTLAAGGCLEDEARPHHPRWRECGDLPSEAVSGEGVDVVEADNAFRRYTVISRSEREFSDEVTIGKKSGPRRPPHRCGRRRDRGSEPGPDGRLPVSLQTRFHLVASAQSDQSSASTESAMSASACSPGSSRLRQ